MASTEGRRSFLLSITLSELSFIMFFLLMIISASVLQKTQQELAQEAQEKQSLQAEMQQLKRDSDVSFKRLQLLESRMMQAGGFATKPSGQQLDELFSKLQNAQVSDHLQQENAQLQAELNALKVYKQLIAALQAAGIKAQQPALQLQQLLQQVEQTQQAEQLLKGQVAYLQNKLQGNGLDHAPCWANPTTGDIEYLYNMTLYERSIKIVAAWPEHRAQEVLQIPNAQQLAGKVLTQQQFADYVKTIYAWSVAHECRHFVRIKDDPYTSKAAFKRQMLAIEAYFYKYLQR
ncbi:MAG: hypothetical protein GQ582_07265 [Methyloprofundus sp.]|nr:hypothetical protein [Methyloprofundus sp.]